MVSGLPCQGELGPLPCGILKFLSNSSMEKKKIDEYEPGPPPSPRPLDRFGFVKQEVNNSPHGLTKGRSAYEFERYGVSSGGHFQYSK